MDNFCIGIEQDKASGAFQANFLNGQTVSLDASNYEDVVLEADLIDEVDLQLEAQ